MANQNRTVGRKSTQNRTTKRATGKAALRSSSLQRMPKFAREVLLVAIAALIFYLFVCLLSYSPADPGPTNQPGQLPVQNWGGGVGAWIADALMAGFGKISYFFLILIAGAAWRYLGVDKQRDPSDEIGFFDIFAPIIGFVIAMIGACGLDALYFESPVSNPYASGGVLGALVNQGLLSKFGVVGTTLLLFAFLLVGITLVTRLPWFQLMEWLGRTGFMLYQKAKIQVTGLIDQLKGGRERKRRTESVTAVRQAINKKSPPKITPKTPTPVISERYEKEKQLPLFTSEGDGGFPPLTLLDSVADSSDGYSEKELAMMSHLLVKKLKDFNIDITVEAVQPGPVITRFEIDLAAGVKASQVVGLGRDLARALSVVSIRVVENIPGKSLMGIEIPNQTREIVQLLDVLSSEIYEKAKAPLTVVLGKDIAGFPVVLDLAKTPHILVAGTTGSGKSVCINTLIMSLVYKNTPEQVRLIMVDPKMLELSVYEDIPHLLAPVVTDMKKASNALRWCIGEMDRRFRIMAALGVRNVVGYNKKVKDAQTAGEPIRDPLFEATLDDVDAEAPFLEHLPYIVVIVDELADLMMITKKKIEEVIIRIAQRARAAGIHLVLATQRPSVDVVTGLIKANVPSRIAFQVSSRADSRTVLDQMGAEQLLGQGDMLFLPPGVGHPQRVHGAFVSDDEVRKVTEHLRKAAKPVYIDEITEGEFGGDFNLADPNGAHGDDNIDELYDRAVFFVTKERKASISAVQRYLRVGYNRAARMVEMMEESGIVGPLESGSREILAPPPPELD